MPRPMIAPSSVLTIAEMAALKGVSYRTLRFYEHKGLLKPHRVGSARFYLQKDCLRLDVILKAKRLGFGLAEIERLLGGADTTASEPAPDLFSQLTKNELAAQIDRLADRRKGVQAAIDGLTEALATKVGS